MNPLAVLARQPRKPGGPENHGRKLFPAARRFYTARAIGSQIAFVRMRRVGLEFAGE
ncbi:MAG TPA: hypothetical protein VG077_16065 [Verrucomicrobiae bacterium]|nr:hypothetical protein [Verrucomicrobiae bacterium]